jgi:hypothetical protein
VNPVKRRRNDIFTLEQEADGAPCRLSCSICKELLFDPARDTDLSDLAVDLHIQLHYSVEHSIELEENRKPER